MITEITIYNWRLAWSEKCQASSGFRSRHRLRSRAVAAIVAAAPSGPRAAAAAAAGVAGVLLVETWVPGTARVAPALAEVDRETASAAAVAVAEGEPRQEIATRVTKRVSRSVATGRGAGLGSLPFSTAVSRQRRRERLLEVAGQNFVNKRERHSCVGRTRPWTLLTTYKLVIIIFAICFFTRMYSSVLVCFRSLHALTTYNLIFQ